MNILIGILIISLGMFIINLGNEKKVDFLSFIGIVMLIIGAIFLLPLIVWVLEIIFTAWAIFHIITGIALVILILVVGFSRN